MKRLRLLGLLFLALSVGCAGAPTRTRVLFIGNSYTSVNDLPTMVQKLAEAGGRIIDSEMDCPGGMTLDQHWKNGRAREYIQKTRWDWVVLQDQSQLPSFPEQQLRKQMYPSVRELNRCIAASGARPLLYMTWGHREGDPDNFSHDTYAAMQLRLRHGYENIARELGIPVAPAGLAWELALQRSPKLQLWTDDGSHPTVAGTYLAACVMYQVMFGKSALGNRFTAGLDATTCRLLQRAAADTVSAYPLARSTKS